MDYPGDSGYTDSSPWISSFGEIAHPDSPRGGGGLGRFTIPGPLRPLQAEGRRSEALPHPQSPAGRNVLASDVEGILLADLRRKTAPGTAASKQTPRVVVFSEFNNKSRGKYVEHAKPLQMGVHPPGNLLPFVNAVELIFKVDEKLAKKMGIKHYRCRQRVDSQEVWEITIKDDRPTPWTLSISTPPFVPAESERDDPVPSLQATTPPFLAFYDAPGFMFPEENGQLRGPNEKRTAMTAMALFLRQNFIAWIDGARGSGKNQWWEPVSDEVKWHSNQRLARNIFSKGIRAWSAVAEGSEIELGHTKGQPPK